MTKLLFLVDRNLVGTSLVNRRKKWELSENARRGHPMISRQSGHGSTTEPADYLRKCMARYYSWRIGGGPNQYENFAYLSTDPLDQNTWDKTTSGIVFHPTTAGVLNQGTIQPIFDTPQETTTMMSMMYQGGLSGPAGDLLFGVIPSESEYYSTVGVEIRRMILSGAASDWAASSLSNGITGDFENLFNAPEWSNWQAYTMGGTSVGGHVENVPGIFGENMAGTIFKDHVFLKNVSNGFVTTNANYNYYNQAMEEMTNNSQISELYIPNLYIAASVFTNNDGSPTWPGMFDGPTSGVPHLGSLRFIKTMLQRVLGDPLVPGDDDIMDPSHQFTPYQIRAAAGYSNSLLSRFGRRDFTAGHGDLTRARDANRHIAIPRVMLRPPDATSTEISALQARWPLSIDFEFHAGAKSTFVTAMDDSHGQEGSSDEYLGTLVSNYFLYEIMKANIYNFEDNRSPAATALYNGNPHNLYEELSFSAMVADTDPPPGSLSYSGFDWTTPGSTETAWDAASPNAAEDYTLRAIDVNNLMRYASRYQFNPDIPEGQQYGGPYQSNNGLVNQTTEQLIASSSGLIVGNVLNPGPLNQNILHTQAQVLGNNMMATGLETFENFMEFNIEFSDELTKKMRSYGELMSVGPKSWCEPDTLAYKVDKHSVSDEGIVSTDPIQSIYFANVGGAIKYVDTQVFYRKAYVYKLYAYDLVVGNQYKYNNPEVKPPIQQRYPSPLSSMLTGYVYANSNMSMLNQAYFTHEWPLVSDEPHKILVSNVYTLPANPPGNEALLDPTYQMYSDVSIDGFRRNSLSMDNQLATVFDAEGNPVTHGTAIVYGSTFAARLELLLNSQIAAHWSDTIGPDYNSHTDPPAIQQQYTSQFRVRYLTRTGTQPGQKRGRFLIAQVSALREDPSGIYNSLAGYDQYSEASPTESPEDSATAQSYYQQYFNLMFDNGLPENVETREIVSGYTPMNLVMDWKTGQHGTAPEIPWNMAAAGTVTVDLYNFKSPKIIEIPLGTSAPTKVTDLPPQFPEAEVFPLKGNSREIKILLNENKYKARWQPIIIEDADAGLFEEMRMNQFAGPDEAILFGSDDHLLNFEVFRTTTPPTSYADFAGKRTHLLSTETPSGNRPPSTSLLDKIDPNVVYYYCFRTVDVNGQISNPTPILRITMVDDNGRAYLIVEPYDLPDDSGLPTEASFRRFLQIDASMAAKKITLAGNPPPVTAGDPLLPPSNVSMPTSLWNTDTTMKVRITSKDTGRKLDLNLNFTVEPIPNPKIQGN
jgi:hypothetical protein